ncbi:unnamed protein product [Urochloa decumbens]|uniref:AP2/ERF domain-containing protein n=1 Tax=Urochloa decumbens TaxID=240449 RepID=A0ABC9EBF0_9POAL
MQNGGVVELAREAAAAARAEQRRARPRGAAAVAAAPPAPECKFRGVQRRGRRYAATLWNPYEKKAVWLGSYETPVEAAHAYDAAARRVLGRWARPNFPNPSSAPVAGAPAAAPPASQAPEPSAAARNDQQPPAPQPQGPVIQQLAPAPADAAAAAPLMLRLRIFYRPGMGLYAVPVVPPGAYHVPVLINNVPAPAVANQHPVSVAAVSSAAPADASQSGSAAAAGEPERRELPASPAMAAVELVGDNFTGIESSSVARRGLI